MELVRERVDTPALPSASVLLLRDGPDGLEVFLQQRHAASPVLAGAYVFPGGKLDPADAAPGHRLDTPPQQLHERLAETDGTPERSAALFVAAIRELFEEAGVLLADVTPQQAAAAWRAQQAGADVRAATAQRTLAASALQPWSRWITPALPSVLRQRFDTRFFLARLPAGQQASHDAHEISASAWLRPRAMLLRYWEGGIAMAPPQILALAHLARHARADSVFVEAARTPPPCVRPQPLDIEGERVLCYPGDPWHPDPRLFEGPTRLRWRNGRFEPEGGLPALLGDGDA